MARIKLEGFENYIKKLEHIESYTHQYIGKAIYSGAEVVANNVKNELLNLKVDNRKKVDMRTSINSIQRRGLIDSFGIAKLREDGDFINVKLGFDGYNDFTTYSYPNGQPNVMIARSLESGTSFMPKNPIISKAVSASKNACIKKMEESIVNDVNDLFK